MGKGIIYIMTSVVPGLIKIGKTGSDNFDKRMQILENNGYSNVTGFKRVFAIEVDKYDEKEKMLHNIFEKSRVADTELFALDVNLVIELLSSFAGKIIFPKTETREEIFDTATENRKSKLIPNGRYKFEKKKKSDNNKIVKATAEVKNGNWKLLKGSLLGISEDAGVSQKAKSIREKLPLDNNGKLLEDVELGECSPSFVGAVVLNQSNDGWTDWKNKIGQPIDIYRNIAE